MAAEILELQGYNIICAENAKRALEILERESIDLMLVDIVMPEMDGYELAAKATEKYPELKIQLASGFAGTDHVGMVDTVLNQKLLKKPYHAKILLKNIRLLLDE